MQLKPSLLLLATLLACGGEDWRIEPCVGEDAGTCEVGELRVDGVRRTYLVGRLGGYDCSASNVPLVLYWHGSGANGASDRRAVNETFAGLELERTIGASALVVYPDGLEHPDCGGRTCWERDPSGRDVRFFDALVPHLAERYCVDPERVFSIGHSRGGRFVEVLACHRAGAHVAVAMIAAGPDNVDDCPGSLPVWLSHGVDDEVIAFRHGEAHRDAWAERNGCDPPAAQESALDTCTPLRGCPESRPVVWCPTRVRAWQGHAVPLLADEEIGAFFKLRGFRLESRRLRGQEGATP